MFKHKQPKETKSAREQKGASGALVTLAETPTKPAPDKSSIVKGAKSLDIEELIAHRYASFQHDIKALIESLEDYHESMVQERKARTKAFEKIELFSKQTPLKDAIRTKPSTTTISKRHEKISREHADLFEDKILDYIKEWNDIVSHKFETEMKEMKEYREEKTRRKQQVKQLRTHRDKMLSINKEKAESESPKLEYKEGKLEVATHRYEKHKKILTQILDELIDGSWKDFYPLMANVYQLEMDTANKKAGNLANLQASIDKLSSISQDKAASPSSVSSNTTLWRSLRTDWLNSGPVPTVPTRDEPQPLANTIKTPVPTKEDSFDKEKRNDEEKIAVSGENAAGEREDVSEAIEQRDASGEIMKSSSQGTAVTLIDRQAAFPDTQTSQPEEDQADEAQDKKSGLMSTILPPYFKEGNDGQGATLNEETENFQDAEPGDKQPGLVGSVLPSYYQGETDEPDNTQNEQMDSHEGTQPDDANDKHAGMMSSLLSPFKKGEADEADNVQDEQLDNTRNEQVTDTQYQQTDESREKKSGVVGSITSYLKGKSDEQEESQNEHAALSGLSQLDESQKAQFEKSHYPEGQVAFDQPTTSLDKSSPKDRPLFSDAVPSDEGQEDEWKETSDRKEEPSEYDQPAAFLDKGPSESKQNRPWLSEKETLDESRANEEEQGDEDQQSKSKIIEADMSQSKQPGESEVDKSVSFLIDQPLAFQVDDPVAFQVVGQPAAVQTADPDDFERSKTDQSQNIV